MGETHDQRVARLNQMLREHEKHERAAHNKRADEQKQAIAARDKKRAADEAARKNKAKKGWW